MSSRSVDGKRRLGRGRKAFLAGLAFSLSGAACVSLAGADNDTNLARAKGAVPFGSGGHGPFTIGKINDGRMDTLGMWGTGGQPGSFGGVKLGDSPVTFNTVRFYLFNGRAAFTGWRLEGSNECEIDEDSLVATLYDPELIVADPDGAFANANTKEHNTVTITFKPVSYQYVRLLFPSKSGLLGIVEIEVFNREDNLTPKAIVGAGPGVEENNIKNTLSTPKPAPAGELIGGLRKPEGATVAAYDGQGSKLKDSDLLKNECSLVVRHVTGGGETPWRTEYKCYAMVDRSAPPPAPKEVKRTNRPPPPPKPLMTPPSCPEAPADAVNLVEGKTITASIDPRGAMGLAKPGNANWFAQQRYPQWFCVELGKDDVEFDCVSLRVLAGLSLQHFWIQVSGDGANWRNLVEVDHVRKNVQWNGYLEKTKARYVRVILAPPSSDVHVKKFVLANLTKPLTDKDGKPVPVLRPVFSETPDFSRLPPAASVEEKGPGR